MSKVSVKGVLALLTWLVSLMCVAHGKVHEVVKGNFDEFVNGKFFTLTFLDSTTCTRCRTLFPFFVQAAHVFHNDPEIFLARTHDKNLIKEWGVPDELPALVYHLHGKKEAQPLQTDITVDDIVDMIARLLHGNFAGLKRKYTVQITPQYYNELVVKPRQSVLLLLHAGSGEKKSAKELKNFEKVAYNFRKDDAILFVTLDVVQHEKLRNDNFKTREVPTLMWFEADNKEKPKRFGSFLSVEVLTMFVNEKTGLNRDTEGGILDDAGRVRLADEIVEQNIDIIADASESGLSKLVRQLADQKPKMEPHQIEFLEYYMFILDNIALTKNSLMLRELLHGEEAKLYGMEEMSSKERESIKRRRNILKYMQRLLRDWKENRRKATSSDMEEEELVQIPHHTGRNTAGKSKKGKARPFRHEEL